MNNTFGYEIEFCFDRKEDLALYLSYRRGLLKDNIGCDGAGIFTSEYRSPVFDDSNEFIYHLKSILFAIKDVYPNAKVMPLFISDLSGKPTICPMGFHFSIGYIDINILWRAFKRYLYYKFLYHDKLYMYRTQLYPEMLRWHKDRIEFRFIPNYPDVIQNEVKYILEV